MNKLLKTIPALLLALVVALAVACGGSSDGGDDGSSEDVGANQPDGGAPSAMLISNATDVLGASVQNFDHDVESMRAEFVMDVDMDGFAMAVEGDFAFQSPDQLYMTMEIDTGDASIIDLSEFGTIELLALGSDIYFNMPFLGGWFVMSAEDLGTEIETFDSMFDLHSPFDYEQLIASAGGDVEYLGEESMDGGTFGHYQITVDMADALGSVAEAFGESDTLGFGDIPVDEILGPIVMDLWVNPDNFLPHRIEADLSLEIEGVTGDFAMAFKFFDYNEDVAMPAPPEDAMDFGELFAGLFEGVFDDGEFSFELGE